MAKTYSLKYVSRCGTNGRHITFNYLVDSVVAGQKVVDINEVENCDLTWDDVIPFLLKHAIANSGATTLARKRTAIEAMVLTL